MAPHASSAEASDRRCRVLVENAFDLVHIIDAKNRVTWISDSVRQMLGYDAAEVLDRSCVGFVHEDDQARMTDYIESVRRGRGPEPIRIRVRRKDGAWRVLEAVGRDLGSDPDIGGFIINERDVTDRAEAETALREAEERFEIVQRAASFGVWYSDPGDAGKLVWTSGCHGIFGLAPDAFDGRVETFFSLVHPDDLDDVRAASRDALSGKRRYSVDHRIVRPGDGAVRWVHQEADVRFDAQGRAQQMIGMVQDIDGRKRAEQEARDRADELEKTLRLMVGREQKMIELKKRIRELEARVAGQAP